MKIKYVKNQKQICPNIKMIYKLVLKDGWRIKRLKNPEDGVIYLRLWKPRETLLGRITDYGSDSVDLILYPSERVIKRKGHGERC